MEKPYGCDRPDILGGQKKAEVYSPELPSGLLEIDYSEISDEDLEKSKTGPGRVRKREDISKGGQPEVWAKSIQKKVISFLSDSKNEEEISHKLRDIEITLCREASDKGYSTTQGISLFGEILSQIVITNILSKKEK